MQKKQGGVKQKAKQAAKAVGKAAVNAAKEAARDIVKEELKRLPRELRAPAGRVGNALVKGASKIFGHGDYTIHSNSLIHGGHVAPVFTNSQHGVRIVDREFVGTVTSGSLASGSTVFTNSVFRINPSNPTLFPWLSRIAPLFDQWMPHGIVVEFVSTSSEYNGSTQALGVVIVATDYDVNDQPYGTRIEMENSAYAISAKASSNILHGMECSVSERPTRLLYTESANVGTRSNLSDLGNLQVATQGMSAAGITLGELYITYDIEFYKKQMRPAQPDSIVFTMPSARAFLSTDAWSKGLTVSSGSATGLFALGATVDDSGNGGLITFVPNVEYVGRTIRMLSQTGAFTAVTASEPYIDVLRSTNITRVQVPSGIATVFSNPSAGFWYQDFVVTAANWSVALIALTGAGNFQPQLTFLAL